MKKYLLILFLFSSIYSKGVVIYGIILESKTLIPIANCNVYVNQYTGTTSDINGNFFINIKNAGSKDVLSVSCIGYVSKTLSLNLFDTINLNKILLNAVVYNLDQIEVLSNGITPYNLLQSAFDKIKDNFKNEKHYLKGTYFEKINNYDPLYKWHSRTVNAAVIIEDPGYDRLHGSWLSEWLPVNFLENIYILGISKGYDSLVNVPAKDGNYLTWTMEENYCRYKNEIFKSPKTYNYGIKSSYFDSLLKTNIIEISITPKNTKEEYAYAEVFISSSDHKIFKIHRLYKNEDYPVSIQTNKNEKDYYKHLNSDITLLYRPDNENKMMLSYAKYEFGEGYFYYEQNKPHVVAKFFTEYKTVGEVENGYSLIKIIPKMDKTTNIYNQKIMNNKAFWLDYNIKLKE
jgi:hypothetical protein